MKGCFGEHGFAREEWIGHLLRSFDGPEMECVVPVRERDQKAGAGDRPSRLRKAFSAGKGLIVGWVHGLGTAIFSEDLGVNCQPDRCPGFNNNDGAQGLEQALAGMLFGYADNGATVRNRARQDLNRTPCHDLLARKYNWLREHVFRGFE